MLPRRTVLGWAAAPLLRALPPAGTRTPELQPYFPTAAHQFVWRNWDLCPATRIAEALGTTTSTVRKIGGQMHLRLKDAVSALEPRMHFAVLRRNWFFVPTSQIARLLGVTVREIDAMLDHDAFYRGHLGPAGDFAPISVSPQASGLKRLAHFSTEPHKGSREARFQFERDLSEPLASTEAHNGGNPQVSIAYPYFCPYGDVLALDDYQRYYPLGLLQRMRANGVSAIWIHALLRDLVPTSLFDSTYPAKPEKLERLRWIVQQCAAAGLGAYVYLNEPRGARDEFFRAHPELRGAPGRANEGLWSLCTSVPATLEHLRTGCRDLFRSVSSLQGLILITASENVTNCYSLTRNPDCPRCSKRKGSEIIGEVVSAIASGAHNAKPDAHIIAWDWSWGIIEDDPQAGIIAALPKNVSLQVDFERGTPIERLGVKAQVDEYSLSVPGPSPRAAAHIDLARKHNLPVMAKTQIGTTWELATVPFLPVLDLLAEKLRALQLLGVHDGMFSWTLGSCPSVNWELLARMEQTNEQPLLSVASRRYGSESAKRVVRAWKTFSDAFRSYPFSNSLVYSSFVLEGPALRLYAQPTGQPARILNSFDNLGWTAPFGPERVSHLFREMASHWLVGLRQFEQAMPVMTDAGRARARRDLLVTEAAGLFFESVALSVDFYQMRNGSTPPGASLKKKSAASGARRGAVSESLPP